MDQTASKVNGDLFIVANSEENNSQVIGRKN